MQVRDFKRCRAFDGREKHYREQLAHDDRDYCTHVNAYMRMRTPSHFKFRLTPCAPGGFGLRSRLLKFQERIILLPWHKGLLKAPVLF